MKLRAKITLTTTGLVLLASAATLGTLLFQHERTGGRIEEILLKQARGEVTMMVETVLQTCVASEARNQRRLVHNLGVAREFVARQGGLHPGTEVVEWQAINQLSKETTRVTAPKFLAGTLWPTGTPRPRNPCGMPTTSK